jgi:hypothetical protein
MTKTRLMEWTPFQTLGSPRNNSRSENLRNLVLTNHAGEKRGMRITLILRANFLSSQ